MKWIIFLIKNINRTLVNGSIMKSRDVLLDCFTKAISHTIELLLLKHTLLLMMAILSFVKALAVAFRIPLNIVRRTKSSLKIFEDATCCKGAN